MWILLFVNLWSFPITHADKVLIFNNYKDCKEAAIKVNAKFNDEKYYFYCDEK